MIGNANEILISGTHDGRTDDRQSDDDYSQAVIESTQVPIVEEHVYRRYKREDRHETCCVWGISIRAGREFAMHVPTGWTKAAVASTGETISEVLSMCRAVATAESRVYRELGSEQLYEGEAGSSSLNDVTRRVFNRNTRRQRRANRPQTCHLMPRT